jgi:hypothetical protein
VKVEASSMDSRVMPTKQFTVGSLTEENTYPIKEKNTTMKDTIDAKALDNQKNGPSASTQVWMHKNRPYDF